MKVATAIVGFLLVCVGIGALAGQVAVLGVHPAVWFILGAGLLVSDSAWERLARKKADGEEESDEETPSDTTSPENPDSASSENN